MLVVTGFISNLKRDVSESHKTQFPVQLYPYQCAGTPVFRSDIMPYVDGEISSATPHPKGRGKGSFCPGPQAEILQTGRIAAAAAARSVAYEEGFPRGEGSATVQPCT